MLIDVQYQYYQSLSATNISSLLTYQLDKLQLPETPVYIATGQPIIAARELQKLHPTMKIVYRQMVSGDLEPKDYIIRAAVDQEMCLYSNVFISTMQSSFGANTFFARSAVHAVLHSDSPIHGPSYSYQPGSKGFEGCDAYRNLQRVGVAAKRSADASTLEYTLLSQVCGQTAGEFIETLFAGVDETIEIKASS